MVFSLVFAKRIQYGTIYSAACACFIILRLNLAISSFFYSFSSFSPPRKNTKESFSKIFHMILHLKKSEQQIMLID